MRRIYKELLVLAIMFVGLTCDSYGLKSKGWESALYTVISCVFIVYPAYRYWLNKFKINDKT